jgi:hypothetical protein
MISFQSLYRILTKLFQEISKTFTEMLVTLLTITMVFWKSILMVIWLKTLKRYLRLSTHSSYTQIKNIQFEIENSSERLIFVLIHHLRVLHCLWNVISPLIVRWFNFMVELVDLAKSSRFINIAMSKQEHRKVEN